MRQLLKNKGGQATVEYLLLIMLVITLALSIGRPLGEYLTNLSGSLLGPDDGYYACLMEEAKLPGGSVSCSKPDIDPLVFPPGSGGFGGGGSGGGPEDGSGVRGGSNDSNRSSDDSGGDGDSGDGDSSESDEDGSGEDGSGRKGGRNKGDSARNRSSLPSRHKAGAGSDSLSGGADSVLGRAQNQSEFLASQSSSSRAEEEGELGSKLRRGRRKKKKSGAGFNDSGQEGYKQNRGRDNSEFFVGYLGERYVEEKEKESKKVFKSDAAVSLSSGGSGAQGEDEKSAVGDSSLIDRGPSKETEVKKMNFMQFIRYIVLAILIILVLAFLFSQAMEYQSRD